MSKRAKARWRACEHRAVGGEDARRAGRGGGVAARRHEIRAVERERSAARHGRARGCGGRERGRHCRIVVHELHRARHGRLRTRRSGGGGPRASAVVGQVERHLTEGRHRRSVARDRCRVHKRRRRDDGAEAAKQVGRRLWRVEVEATQRDERCLRALAVGGRRTEQGRRRRVVIEGDDGRSAEGDAPIEAQRNRSRLRLQSGRRRAARVRVVEDGGGRHDGGRRGGRGVARGRTRVVCVCVCVCARTTASPQTLGRERHEAAHAQRGGAAFATIDCRSEEVLAAERHATASRLVDGQSGGLNRGDEPLLRRIVRRDRRPRLRPISAAVVRRAHSRDAPPMARRQALNLGGGDEGRDHALLRAVIVKAAKAAAQTVRRREVGSPQAQPCLPT